MHDAPLDQTSHPARQALLLWVAFIVVSVVIHATIPFIQGDDVRKWVDSEPQFMLSGFVVYGILFLAAPLVIVKGWPTVRQPGFLIPLLLTVFAAALWHLVQGIGVLIIVALGYLHWRYDLSELGIRSSGWQGDALAILLIASLYSIPRFFRPLTEGFDFAGGLQAGLSRLLANPATSAEYFFYFGFLATRFSKRLGFVVTPIIIGLMYMTHEMSNPEYWYEGMQFPIVFLGVAFAAAIYLWRESLLPIWLGDGLARFAQGLLK